MQGNLQFRCFQFVERFEFGKHLMYLKCWLNGYCHYAKHLGWHSAPGKWRSISWDTISVLLAPYQFSVPFQMYLKFNKY